MPKKKKKIFFDTCLYIIFLRAFQKYSFRSVALVINSNGLFYTLFLHTPYFLPLCTPPYV